MNTEHTPAFSEVNGNCGLPGQLPLASTTSTIP